MGGNVTTQLFVVDSSPPRAYLPRVTLVLLYARVVHQADVVVDVEVEKRPGLPPGLGDYQVIEREVLNGRRKRRIEIKAVQVVS